jgi:hypothetical protein
MNTFMRLDVIHHVSMAITYHASIERMSQDLPPHIEPRLGLIEMMPVLFHVANITLGYH